MRPYPSEEQETSERAILGGFPEDKITEALSCGGTIQPKSVFLLNGLIYTWHQEYHLRVLVINDNRLASACRVYLRSKGAVYGSIDEVAKAAEREGWPNYHWLSWRKAISDAPE
jgi:hypothetical protein